MTDEEILRLMKRGAALVEAEKTIKSDLLDEVAVDGELYEGLEQLAEKFINDCLTTEDEELEFVTLEEMRTAFIKRCDIAFTQVIDTRATLEATG